MPANLANAPCRGGTEMDVAPIAEALHDARATLDVALRESELRRLVIPALDAMEKAEAALKTERRDPDTARSAAERALERRIAELEETNRAHDEFLSTLGHELRNPLSPIFMQAQHLLDTARKAEAAPMATDWLIPRLEMFCRRLSKFLEMLNRIMDVSRMSAGRITLELEEVDLAEVVREVSASFERELVTARSELRLHAPDHLVGTWDRMRVEHIFTNLLSNAIRYGAGKPIECCVAGDELHATLRVRDYGIGIAEAEHERIFQRFERAVTTRKSGGFGIGLWTVRESCRAMKGSVEVRSQPGTGAEFTVRLPRRFEGAP